MKKRIETGISRTAEWTCICRAASSFEKDACYKSNDTVALKILPQPIKTLIQIPIYRTVHCRFGVPKGMYPYVIARTKYMDAVYERAISDRFDRIVILGAGFDTRAIRVPVGESQPLIYEFDSIHTQQRKLDLYQRNGIPSPVNLKYEAIDFVKESLSERLERVGFPKNERCLFLMEGVSMYLEPDAMQKVFRAMTDHMSPYSRVAFDYIHADVLRNEKKHYGETEIMKSVGRVNESWRFGIEKDALEPFLADYDLRLVDHLSSKEMEDKYFKDDRGKKFGHVNGTHCLVTAEKRCEAA